MNTRKFIVGQWRAMRWIWVAMLIGLIIILAINFGHALSSGEPLPWLDALGGVGILVGATAILWLARHWFNLVAGAEICKWRSDR